MKNLLKRLTLAKALFPITAALAVGLSLLSCDKTPTNGPLDGMWRLDYRASRLNADGAQFSPVEVNADNPTYWNIQLQLLTIVTPNSLHNGMTSESVARFSYDGSELSVGPIYIHYRDRDSLLTDPSTTALALVGITGNEATFSVLQLNSKRMILRSSTDSLVFKKI